MLCGSTALGLTGQRCSGLKFCCFQTKSDTCAADMSAIARRFSPVMKPIADLEMACSFKQNQADCEAS